MTGNSDTPSIFIVVPVFNDWKCFALLLDRIEVEFADANWEITLLAVDDASTETSQLSSILTEKRAIIRQIQYIRLNRNVGHQQAIATALEFIHTDIDCDLIAIMDADGQDSPRDLVRLTNHLQDQSDVDLVFGRRQSRTEGILFRWFYKAYTVMFRVFTGIPIRFGHFCVIKKGVLECLINSPKLAISFVGTILSSRIRFSFVNTSRNQRFEDESKMRFFSLVTHGLGAFVACGAIIGRRVLRFTMGLVFSGSIGYWLLDAKPQELTSASSSYQVFLQIGMIVLSTTAVVAVFAWVGLVVFGLNISRRLKIIGPVLISEQNSSKVRTESTRSL